MRIPFVSPFDARYFGITALKANVDTNIVVNQTWRVCVNDDEARTATLLQCDLLECVLDHCRSTCSS